MYAVTKNIIETFHLHFLQDFLQFFHIHFFQCPHLQYPAFAHILHFFLRSLHVEGVGLVDVGVDEDVFVVVVDVEVD